MLPQGCLYTSVIQGHQAGVTSHGTCWTAVGSTRISAATSDEAAAARAGIELSTRGT